MITCKLTLTDWKTKKATVKTITPKNPQVAAEIHSRNNPNCSVVVEYYELRLKRVTLLPYSMILDQNLVDEGEMSINRFTTKWYGKVSKSKMKLIEQEIASEFVEEEEEIEEEVIELDEE
jgi:hypothetical protein